MIEDSMIYFGGQVKALDSSGKVGGMLVTFSDGRQRDLQGEYFTKSTYLGARDGNGVDVLFHHGQPLPVSGPVTPDLMAELEAFRLHRFSTVKTTRSALGIFAETVLKLSDAYEKAVFELVQAGKLGWSSGALGHTVQKAPDGQIMLWMIGEASLTPTPAEPLNRAVSVKSLGGLKLASLFPGAAPGVASVASQMAYARFLASQADLALAQSRWTSHK